MRMSLKQKGPLRPPPILPEPIERVSQAIQAWPAVIAATHWHLSRDGTVDGADFYVDEEELGHLHLDGEVHLATTLALRQHLIASHLARPFAFGGSYAGWVEASIADEAGAERAIWLFRLNYDRLRGVPDGVLRDRIAARAAGRHPISTVITD